MGSVRAIAEILLRVGRPGRSGWQSYESQQYSAHYPRMHGPTVGDRVRLGDTNLLVEVEQDYAAYGDEALWGFSKTNRSTRTC